MKNLYLSIAVAVCFIASCTNSTEQNHENGSHKHDGSAMHSHTDSVMLGTQEEFNVAQDTIMKSEHEHDHEHGHDHKH